MKLTSRAQLIRTLPQPGLVIHVLEHWQPQLAGTSRSPKALRDGGRPGIQTNGYYFDGLKTDGTKAEMWSDIPPASKLRFEPDGTVTFFPGEPRTWRQRFEVAV